MVTIYSLSRTLDDQADLESLCRDRELCTEEDFKPNAFYGIGNALRKYAGLSENFPLCAIVPHGIVFDREYLWEAERLARVPIVFNYMHDRDDVYRKRTGKYVVPSASPFLYVRALEADDDPAVRSGTIFFPAHSTHRVIALADYASWAERLLTLDEKFKPITVCIYWKDYLHGAHRPFLDKGIRVVSAGHLYDEHFLFRLYHLLRTHAYASSNVPGSHVFYSLAAGCAYFYLAGDGPEYRTVNKCGEKDKSSFEEALRQLGDLFTMPSDLSGQEQRALYDKLMGESNIQSPIKLKEQILFANKLDRIGFAWDAAGHLYWTWLPMAWSRLIYEAAGKLKRLLF